MSASLDGSTLSSIGDAMRTTLLIASLSLAALLSPLVMAQKGATPQPEYWKLDAESSVILVEDARVPVVTLRLRFPVGRWSSWAREHHAGEAFRIQLYDPEGVLRRRADALGVRPWFFVLKHAMGFTITFLKDDTAEVMDLVRDIFSNRSFDRRELRRWQKGVALGWREQENTPNFRLEKAISGALFRPGDPRLWDYERPARGSTDIKALVAARDTVLRLPGRQIGLAGCINRAGAERLIEGLLPPLLAQPPQGLAPEFMPPLQSGDRPSETTVSMRRLTQVYMKLSRLSLDYSDPDYPAFLVADHVLGGNFYSRLSVALRHKKGDTYGAGTMRQGGIDVDAYGLFSFTRTANADAAEDTLRGVLQAFHDAGITREEREVASSYLLGRCWKLRESPESVLAEAMWEQRFALPRGFRDTLAEQAAACSLEKINTFIRRFYEPKNFFMVSVRPR